MAMQRMRHDGCGRAVAGWLWHDTDWLGRTVERCEACGDRRMVQTVVPVTAKRVRSEAAMQAARERVFAAVPVGRAQAISRARLAEAADMPETTLREHLRVLTSGRRVKVAEGRREGRGSGRRICTVYWREA